MTKRTKNRKKEQSTDRKKENKWLKENIELTERQRTINKQKEREQKKK